MSPMSPTLFRNLIRIARPLWLLAGVLFYALGVGLVHFLGYAIDWQIYWAGQAIVTFLQLSSYFLKVYYDAIPTGSTESPVTDRDKPMPGQLTRTLVLQLTLVLLTSGAAMTVLLLASGSIDLTAFVLLGVGFVLSFFYAVPPVRLVERGYGELASAFFIANLVPALAYLFQTGELHRLLAMLTFPLLALFLAYTLAAELRSYGADERHERKTLLVRMGWQRGMLLHNILVLAAYLLLALAALLGLPWLLTWPGLLSLPVGLFQIWQINRIEQGSPPHWNLLELTAFSSLGLMVYLLSLSLWTN